jgi:glycosyltransferase involved in cell wall biosynthesis
MTFAARTIERYMFYALRRADLVIGASDGITRLLIEGGVEPGKTVTVPNGISADLLDEIGRATAAKVEKQRPVVAYAGVIGYNQGLGDLLEGARALPGVDFVLAGDGPELPSLKKKAGELGVNNVSFAGYLGREKLLELYRQSDVLIAYVRSSPTIDASMVPVKLFEYMATGRPIVYVGRGMAADLLRQIGCAVTVTPGDAEAVSAAIEELLGDAERMRVLGQRGRARVRSDFHRHELMEDLARALKERFEGAHDA